MQSKPIANPDSWHHAVERLSAIMDPVFPGMVLYAPNHSTCSRARRTLCQSHRNHSMLDFWWGISNRQHYVRRHELPTNVSNCPKRVPPRSVPPPVPIDMWYTMPHWYRPHVQPCCPHVTGTHLSRPIDRRRDCEWRRDRRATVLPVPNSEKWTKCFIHIHVKVKRHIEIEPHTKLISNLLMVKSSDSSTEPRGWQLANPKPTSGLTLILATTRISLMSTSMTVSHSSPVAFGDLTFNVNRMVA